MWNCLHLKLIKSRKFLSCERHWCFKKNVKALSAQESMVKVSPPFTWTRTVINLSMYINCHTCWWLHLLLSECDRECLCGGLGRWLYAHNSHPNQSNQIGFLPQMSPSFWLLCDRQLDYGCLHSLFSFQCLPSIHRSPSPSHASSNALHLSPQINLPRLSYFRYKMIGVMAYAFFFSVKKKFKWMLFLLFCFALSTV